MYIVTCVTIAYDNNNYDTAAASSTVTIAQYTMIIKCVTQQEMYGFMQPNNTFLLPSNASL